MRAGAAEGKGQPGRGPAGQEGQGDQGGGGRGAEGEEEHANVVKHAAMGC